VLSQAKPTSREGYIYYDRYLTLDSLIKFFKTRLTICQVAEKDDGVSNAWTTVLGTIQSVYMSVSRKSLYWTLNT
jgi:hypothetical protein